MTDPSVLSALLASGGDERIELRKGANTNQYGASPFPRSVRAYAASTANDVSLAAFDHLQRHLAAVPERQLDCPFNYERGLDAIRDRMRACWSLAGDVDIGFAASGTDLEYLPLAVAIANSAMPVTNILLGQDEVGSGCVLSAAGRHFASATPLAVAVIKGQCLAGLEGCEVAPVPIREEDGRALCSHEIRAAIRSIAQDAVSRGRHVLVHVIHGSKTGLVLPHLEDIDALALEFGQSASFVVDACQGRLSRGEMAAYLDRGCAVLVTGSKFIGGPPFSGFALFRSNWRPKAKLAAGLALVFRHGELPLSWREFCRAPRSANPGLLLRLEAAQFELERYAAIDPQARDGVIDAFGKAVRSLRDRLGARLVEPSLAGPGHLRLTLATLDLSTLPASPDHLLAKRWHRILAARGLRLGQPVKYARNAGDRWAGTLRLSLSMPSISELAAMPAPAIRSRFGDDMDRIAAVIEAAQNPGPM